MKSSAHDNGRGRRERGVLLQAFKGLTRYLRPRTGADSVNGRSGFKNNIIVTYRVIIFKDRAPPARS